MRRLLALIPLLAACTDLTDQVAGPSAGTMPTAASAAVSQQDLRDRYIVVFRDDVANPAAVAAQLTRQFGGAVHFTYQHTIKGFAATLPPAAVAGIQRNPNVIDVEPDGIATIVASGSDNTVSSWGLDRVDQHDLPLSKTYSWSVDGSGVTAYIIDTGIRTSHNEFGGRASVGFDAVGGGQNGQDCHGHGTHVAGTVGGGEYGIARSVSLVAVRVLNCAGSGTWSQVIAGVDWVGGNASAPAVANMSLGGGHYNPLNNAVTAAINKGVTFAIAAGNNNANACNYSPASTPAAITVGATTSSDNRASYSNYGTCLDIFAPGSSITSAWNTNDGATKTISGTSMASPHVAGVAALYLSANPGATPGQVAQALVDNATLNAVNGAGSGSPNRLLYSLFMGGGGGGVTPNNPPVASFEVQCTDLSCSFTDKSTDSDGTIKSYSWSFGDNSSSAVKSPAHTYAAGGTYTVSLTVTDDDNATNSTSQSVKVTEPAPSGGISLTVTPYKVKGWQTVDLSWTGASGSVDVFRDGVKIASSVPGSAYTDDIHQRGGGTYEYVVCSTNGCSLPVTAAF